MYPRGPAATKYWDQIPLGLDVLITHGPPLGILDQVAPGGDHLGCEGLLRAVEEKRIAPGKRANCRGHIDPGRGLLFEGLDNGTANVG
jgi:Icc-related predicted phosphoesterase